MKLNSYYVTKLAKLHFQNICIHFKFNKVNFNSFYCASKQFLQFQSINLFKLRAQFK